jgi:DNA gyrase subunit A
VYVRARVEIETDEKRGRQTIVVTELPYQVNKALLLERIAELVHDGKIEDIAELRDESDKSGMRMVIDLKRGAVADVILNNLYEHTAMQSVFGINAVALVNGQPRLLNLKEMIEAFLRHRREVVTRRSIYDLRKSRERAHILEGLAVALESIDEMIALIKAAKDPDEARVKMLARTWPAKMVTKMLSAGDADLTRPEGLDKAFGLTPKGYRLTETQAQAILDLRLHRLTGLEQEKTAQRIRRYPQDHRRPARHPRQPRSPDAGDPRRADRDPRAVRRQAPHRNRAEPREPQHGRPDRRRGRGGDPVARRLHQVAAARGLSRPAPRRARQDRDQHEGRGFRRQAADRQHPRHDPVFHQPRQGVLEEGVRDSAGRARRARQADREPAVAGRGREVSAILPVKDFDKGGYVFMATSDGTVKKTELVEFTRPRSTGIRAIELKPGNQLIGVGLTDGKCDILLFSDAGKVVRFGEDDVREMGRTARGVRGLMLKKDQSVIALIIACPDQAGKAMTVLTATKNGYGKRTPLEDYPKHRRGGQGVISIQVNERNGPWSAPAWSATTTRRC